MLSCSAENIQTWSSSMCRFFKTLWDTSLISDFCQGGILLFWGIHNIYFYKIYNNDVTEFLLNLKGKILILQNKGKNFRTVVLYVFLEEVCLNQLIYLKKKKKSNFVFKSSRAGMVTYFNTVSFS